MTDILSGIVLVAMLTAAVYAVDAAVSSRRFQRWPRFLLIGLSALMIGLGLGLLVGQLALDGDVAPTSLGLISGGVVLAVALSERGRRAVSNVLPIEPDAVRAWAGLVALLWLVIFRLATFYGAESESEFGQVSLAAAAVQTLAFLGITAGLIGFLSRRGWRETLRRLGFERIKLRSIAYAAVIVMPLSIISALTVVAVDFVSPGTTERLSDTVNEITGGDTSLGYGLALGIFAAAGEETLFRGAIQPKYGLIFTSLAFAVLHVQYDLLLVVASLFPVGLILGLERKYLGTMACVVTHALYNTLAVVLG